MPAWFPLLLVAHVALALALLLPSVVLPFVMRGAADGRQPGALARSLVALQANGTLLVGAGVAITGIGLLLVLGLGMLSRPWMLVALALYATNLLVAAFISRPNLRRLVGLPGDVAQGAVWRRRARQQRYVAYGMAAATGLIGFLMSTKPELW